MKSRTEILIRLSKLERQTVELGQAQDSRAPLVAAQADALRWVLGIPDPAIGQPVDWRSALERERVDISYRHRKAAS